MIARGGDDVVAAVSASAGQPATILGLRNFILLTKFFATIPPGVLQSQTEAGALSEKQQQAPGMLQLLRRVSRPENRHALSVGLDLMEATGKRL